MNKTPIPSSYPAEGVFQSSIIHVDLSCMDSNAEIHYTLDGSIPTEQSPLYVRDDGLIPLSAEHGSDTINTINAFAVSSGKESSPMVSFTYRMLPREKGKYAHQIMQEPADNVLGIIRIEDFDCDKMYLLVGSKRAVLVDAGWDYTADVYSLCQELVGKTIPIDLVIAHGHPDHIAQIGSFQKAGCRVYMPHADINTVYSFCPDMDLSNVIDIKEGDTLDLGNVSLDVYTIPGHTPGSIVLLDETTGNLFSSDTLGSNRSYIGDSAWLQISGYSLEEIYKNLKKFMRKTDGKITRIFSGHNDVILDTKYLNSVIAAFEVGLSKGDNGVHPSLRSAKECYGSGSVVSCGNWRIDPNWAAANIKYMYEKDKMANPPKTVKGFNSLLSKNHSDL